MKMTIEELKQWVKENSENGKRADAIRELIAIRELKADQVPVAWTSQRSLETKNKIVAFTDDMSALDYGVANGWTDIVELFTAPQKPIVLLPPAYEKSSDFTEYHQGWNACRNYMLAEAREVGGIVKDGE